MSAITGALLAIFVLFLGACQASVKEQKSIVITANKLYSSSNCSGLNTKPYSMMLTDRNQLEQMIRKITRNIFGSSRPPVPNVDFDHNLVLLLSMGQFSTAGYALSLKENSVDVKDGVAHIVINWHEPAPGAFTAQVITSPCILIALPAGTYHSIMVTDQMGKQKFDSIKTK